MIGIAKSIETMLVIAQPSITPMMEKPRRRNNTVDTTLAIWAMNLAKAKYTNFWSPCRKPKVMRPIMVVATVRAVNWYNGM